MRGVIMRINTGLWIAILVGLTAINLTAVAINLSTDVRASVAGMDRQDLYRDRDFRYAVEDVIESCGVSGSKIKC
jgi:hypothetical protein